MIDKKAITQSNFDDVVNMRLPKGSFCASNMYSLAEAWLYKENARPFALYKGEELVGFMMLDEDKKARELGLWRMMFKASCQGKGYGTYVVKQLIKDFEQSLDYDYVYLYCAQENKRAQRFYLKCGFKDTGEVEDGEAIFIYPLNDSLNR